jgi:hypothetical protein
MDRCVPVFNMSLVSPKSILSFVASLVLFGCTSANADVAQAIPEIGYLERWTAFSLGGGNGFSLLFGNIHVTGDFGQAGHGKLVMAGSALINGDLYARSNGAVLAMGHPVVSGSIFYNQDPLLDDCVNEALAASNRAFSLTPNRPNTSAKLEKHDNITITGAPGETVVLNLRNFILRGASSFTLQGTATTNFIINVRRKFSLKGNAHVDLAGLQWNQVLFNVVGEGHRVSLGGNSVFGGILMANNRTIEVRGDATMSGTVVGNRLKLHGSGRVLHPAIVSQ